MQLCRQRGLKLKDRAGSDVDKGRLDQVFKLLGFTVIIYNDPSSEDIRRKLAEKLKLFCTQAQESKTVRCFAVAILAHGDIGKSALLVMLNLRAKLMFPSSYTILD